MKEPNREVKRSICFFCHDRCGVLVHLENGKPVKIEGDPDHFHRGHTCLRCRAVLEHLDHPEKAMAEIKRVASEDIIFSVPNEPLWSFCNLLRLKYLRSMGSTPTHCQKWSVNAFETFVNDFFAIKTIKTALPWTLVLCSVKT